MGFATSFNVPANVCSRSQCVQGEGVSLTCALRRITNCAVCRTTGGKVLLSAIFPNNEQSHPTYPSKDPYLTTVGNRGIHPECPLTTTERGTSLPARHPPVAVIRSHHVPSLGHSRKRFSTPTQKRDCTHVAGKKEQSISPTVGYDGAHRDTFLEIQRRNLTIYSNGCCAIGG